MGRIKSIEQTKICRRGPFKQPSRRLLNTNETGRKSVRHKYGAKRCEEDSIKFPSRLERNYYQKLKLAKKSGELLEFLRQPLFDLPGGVSYRADFIEFWRDGTVRVTDCKGMLTKDFISKKKMVEALYPHIEIEIVKKV